MTGSRSPFLFFTDHGPGLAESVRQGRRAEFAAFDWGARVPDPNDPATFQASKLDWDRAGGATLELWRTLLRLRREVPALGNCRRDLTTARVDRERVLVLRYWQLVSQPAETLNRVARFLEQLASAYHKFYDACRVLPMGDEEISDQLFSQEIEDYVNEHFDVVSPPDTIAKLLIKK